MQPPPASDSVPAADARPRLLLFGGTGSLGNKLIERHLATHSIYVFSRDENKHWKMSLTYHHDPHLHFFIGDVRDANRVRDVLHQVRPHRIVFASALKHIERCEFETREALATNLQGCLNVLDALAAAAHGASAALPDLDCFVFISTDKACFPINTYGMTKALAEKAVVEHAKKYPHGPRMLCVRYGNVLNSRGSILEVLHHVGRDPQKPCFTLTDPRMTRFIMTQDEAVDLIQCAMDHGRTGDTLVPRLRAMRIRDLLDLFARRYKKPVFLTGLRPGEKISEALINANEAARTAPLAADPQRYVVIAPVFRAAAADVAAAAETEPYDSADPAGLVDADALEAYLASMHFL
jgi:UDP-N-acetylglucosamine 4,6-dehydratase/5-epimerase